MYSSLDKIDVVAQGEKGAFAAQTDHRERHEIEAEPEISVLFALCRVLNARRHLEQQGEPFEGVVYVAFGEPPPFLLEALGAAGALLERMPGRARVALPAAVEAPEALADRAFAALAARVRARLGEDDPAEALRALEAETLSDPPARKEDEILYWTRVMELVALAVAAARRGHELRCVTCDDAGTVPFGFRLPGGQIVLPGNRAERFVDDGASETLFLLLESLDELPAGSHEGPLLPSLRSRAEAEATKLLWRPVLPNDAEYPELPVIAYGNDAPKTFAVLREEHAARAAEVHREALANLPGQRVEIQEVETGGEPLLAVTGSFFATEKVLDVEFMRGLHERLRAPLLAVGVPRRGLMFVTSGAQPPERLAALLMATRREHDGSGGRAISRAVLAVSDGRIVGLARFSEREGGNGGSGNGNGNGNGGAKARGWFARLFGKN